MSETLKLSCACGEVKASVEKATKDEGDFVYCHCEDCQSVPKYLGKENRILEANGGTALYQSRCARLSFQHGKDKLAGLHMTDKPTLRWYASCCNTPMFNTYANGKLPYTTVLLANADAEGRAALGEPMGHLHLADAPGDTTGLQPLSMNALLRSFFKRLVKDIFSGDRRRNPLFDPKTLEPISEPHRLTETERQALQSA
ncbi:hypothetical protein K3148_13740 [Qipengyuania aurantiaca]|uniref:CENP-V/GFA domain-containing protein n=1 Tax=Qipengyuania aurantiaca TaxID=2867233 RepID=A0ABX8ZM67_9SPHN|nr:DUF6151 family protein [Qipengyuania aurantiaca]QZD89836.1 hypothetical protein K3148_13740 [Qipengyuania aurantiaca]